MMSLFMVRIRLVMNFVTPPNKKGTKNSTKNTRNIIQKIIVIRLHQTDLL